MYWINYGCLVWNFSSKLWVVCYTFLLQIWYRNVSFLLTKSSVVLVLQWLFLLRICLRKAFRSPKCWGQFRNPHGMLIYVSWEWDSFIREKNCMLSPKFFDQIWHFTSILKSIKSKISKRNEWMCRNKKKVKKEKNNA